ncbi:MAG TPA: glycoside hydrolase family 130 protein [Armatimonadota bacterium]|jgi:predicted GH43/DUF377 family glycosyl hydrolase
MDIAKRFPQNPLISPDDVVPSLPGLEVACLLNPGVFRYEGKVCLLMRVAERQVQREGFLGTLVADDTQATGVAALEFRLDDPELVHADPRMVSYKGQGYLTTLSHLRLATSGDGVHFTVDEAPTLTGSGPLERFGLEDSRVAQIGGEYHLTYTAVSEFGVAVAHTSTRDWKRFERHGLMLPPHNKDCALFEEKVGGHYYCLHRPEGVFLGGPFIWLARSTDLNHWGGHTCLARTRPGMWDEARVGAGAAPIRTEAGWLAIYHGADRDSRYCLGALLLDLEDPTRVLARSVEPFMEPTQEYERKGFFGHVVFTNGHLVDGDQVTLYYGASDTVICGATLSIREVLESLRGAA